MAGAPEFTDIPGCDKATLVAYHEAGHAVASFISGLTIRRVTIEPSEMNGVVLDGHVMPTRMPDHRGIPIFYREGMRRWKRRVLRDLDVTCAGPVAEVLAFPELDDYGTRPYFLGDGDGSDFRAARRFARLIGLAEAGLVEPAEQRVKEIIGESFARVRERLNRLENWWQVKTLADLLAERRTLTGRDAKAVCDRARDDVRAMAG